MRLYYCPKVPPNTQWIPSLEDRLIVFGATQRRQHWSSVRRSHIPLFLSFNSRENDQAANRQSRNKARNNNDQKKREGEEALSDVDTRVLREMLMQSKLDLETEEDVRKLLDRGTKKTVAAPNADDDTNDESEFESRVLQKLTDTKLWKALTAKSKDILESAKIWVSNKVEQDIKTFAALGIFAWDRVVRDVGRALPATATMEKKKSLLLTNTSSFEEVSKRTSTDSLRQELNRPADEIKSVSQDIWDILSGKTTESTDGRGLRTVAKAGTANIADRQRRAFQQQRKKREQQTVVKGIQKIPGGIVEATYELQRDLNSEVNPAGYKTKPIRQAIEAGVVGTGRYLQGIKEAARLAAQERKAKRLQAASTSPETGTTTPVTGTVDQTEKPFTDVAFDATTPTTATSDTSAPSSAQVNRAELLLQLEVERSEMFQRLVDCIQRPDETWLQTEFLTNEARTLSQESLREVAALIILSKDELSRPAPDSNEMSLESVLEQLRVDVLLVQELRDKVVGTISSLIGNTLFDIVVGKYGMDESYEPMLLRRDEIEQLLEDSPSITPPSSYQTVHETRKPEEGSNAATSPFFARSTSSSSSTTAEVVSAEVVSADVVDKVPESVADAEPIISTSFVGQETVVIDSNSGPIFVPEVVSDDDFEDAVGAREAVSAAPQEEEEDVETPKPFLLTAVLRSLDVVFFVLEKVFIVAVPQTIEFASTAARRVGEVNQGGTGKTGWETIRSSADPKGRY